MSTVALFLMCLAGDAPAATPVKPEVALFSKACAVGSEMTEGFGLEKEIGAKTSLADIIDATLLFEHRPAEKRAYTSASIAGQQVKAAVDGNATIVVALDFLLPYAYADGATDEQRKANVEAALTTLETVKSPMILGDVPYLLSASTIVNPIITPRMLPKPEALAAINERVAAWARGRKDVVIAPVAAMYANIEAGEGFGVRASAWPASWLSELLLKDRFHTRMHGTIAAWLLGLDALCKARKDLDPTSFDWSAASIYKKVYAAKEAERKAAMAMEVDSRRQLPNRPPPGPRPPPPTREERDDEVRRKERGEAPRGSGGEDAKKDKDGG